MSVAERPAPVPRAPARDFGVGALLASAGLIVSAAALGLNSIAVARIEGPDGTGLVALSTQVVVIAAFVAGIGLRTSVTFRVGAGQWSPRSAVRGALRASIALGLGGAALGFGAYWLLRDSAMSDFSPLMAASLLGALPFTLTWWILPAVPLACERFEQYALVTLECSLGGAGHLPCLRSCGWLDRHRHRLRRRLRRRRRRDRCLGASIRPNPGSRPRSGARGAGGRRLRSARLGQRPLSVHQCSPRPVHPQRLLRRRRHRRVRGHDLDHVAGLDPVPTPGLGRPAADGEPRSRQRGRTADRYARTSTSPLCGTRLWSACSLPSASCRF